MKVSPLNLFIVYDPAKVNISLSQTYFLALMDSTLTALTVVLIEYKVDSWLLPN